jgi:DNA-binding NtrC family response regulator
MDHDVTQLYIGQSDAVQQVLELARLYAALPGPLLLLGQSGVGKGQLARLLHRLSGRVGDYVVVTGGQLVDTLFQTQLFGSRKGAFTGADRDAPGAFERAHEGTLFLDELPLWSRAAQSAVLRAVDERVILPVGARGELPITCGLVFASNRPLDAMVEEGILLPDLRHRIGDLVIDIAPLTQRRGDIAVLAYHFLDTAPAVSAQRKPVCFSPEALARLLSFDWPGNVRQLERAVAFACVHSRGAEHIEVAHLPPYLRVGPAVVFRNFDSDLRKNLVAWAIAHARGKRRAAAKILGVHPNTVDYHVHRFGAT